MKKAFTLVELIGVIVLLGIIALIAYPVITRTINNSRLESYEETIRQIENAASLYGTDNPYDLPTNGNTIKKISLAKLIQSGYIKKTENGKVYNPIDNSEMQGCVLISFDEEHRQYLYEYSEECVSEIVGVDKENPKVKIVMSGILESSGWYKNPITMTISGTDNVEVSQIKYCMGIDCVPNTITTGANKTLNIENAKETSVCAISIDSSGNESDKKCSAVLKVDSVGPIFSGISDLVVEKNSQIDLLDGVSAIDNGSGISGNITVTPNTIDTTTVGTKEVTYTVTDIAGNVSQIKRRIVIDAEAPTIKYEVIDATPINGWYNEAFYVKATIKDNSGKGIKESYTCVSDSECTPTTALTELEKTFYIYNQESNRICIKTIDNNNKSTTLCSDIYKLDKIEPTLTPIDENITIVKGTSINTSEYFNAPIFGPTGGTLSCNPSNTSSLEIGNHVITCTAIGNNGITTSATKTITIDYQQIINYTMLYDNGNEFTDITGGWIDASELYTTDNYSGTNYTRTRTNNILNLNGYSSLGIVMSLTNDGGTETSIAIRISATPEDVTGQESWKNFLYNKYEPFSKKYILSDIETISGLSDQHISIMLLTNWFSMYNVASTFQKNSNNLYLKAEYRYSYGSQLFSSNIYSISLFKPDDLSQLAEFAQTDSITIADVLNNSSIILNNEAAVRYMLKNCTGDFMASAIQSDTFKTALESSPYKDMVYANEHWNKFLNIAN